MYDLMSLKLKCPVCGESLMDHDRLVDNEPSIRLNIKIADRKGIINLSSIYGSYNYVTDIAIHKDEEAEFNCPKCRALLHEDIECLSCGSEMVPLHLDMGGKVSFCSRSGCKNHKVEFDDLSIALNRLYQEYGYSGKGTPKRMQKDEKMSDRDVTEKKYSKEVIETGSFLPVYCPHCKMSMIENGMLKLKVRNGETGFLLLSPYLNVFTSKSTIYLTEDKTVSDMMCIHCGKSLIADDQACKRCGSPAARIQVGARTKLLSFYICTKKGCKWHGLSKDDLYDIRLEDSMEW